MVERETTSSLRENALAHLRMVCSGTETESVEDLCSKMLRKLELWSSPSVTLRNFPDFCKVLSGLCCEPDLLLDESVCKVILSCVVEFSGCTKKLGVTCSDGGKTAAVNERAAIWGLEELKKLLHGRRSGFSAIQGNLELSKEIGLSSALVSDIVPQLPGCLLEEFCRQPCVLSGESLVKSLAKADECAIKMKDWQGSSPESKLDWKGLSNSVDKLCGEVLRRVEKSGTDFSCQFETKRRCPSFVDCLSNLCENPVCDLSRATSCCRQVFVQIVELALSDSGNLLRYPDDLVESGIACACAYSSTVHVQLLGILRSVSRIERDGLLDWQYIVMVTAFNFTVMSVLKKHPGCIPLMQRFPCLQKALVNLLAVSPGQLLSVTAVFAHLQDITKLLIPDIHEIEKMSSTQWTALSNQKLMQECWLLREFSWWYDIAVALSVNASVKCAYICAVFICCFHYPEKQNVWQIVIDDIMVVRSKLFATSAGCAQLDKLSVYIGIQMIYCHCMKQNIMPEEVPDLVESILGQKLNRLGLKKLSMLMLTRQRVFGADHSFANALEISVSSLLEFCDKLIMVFHHDYMA